MSYGETVSKRYKGSCIFVQHICSHLYNNFVQHIFSSHFGSSLCVANAVRSLSFCNRRLQSGNCAFRHCGLWESKSTVFQWLFAEVHFKVRAYLHGTILARLVCCLRPQVLARTTQAQGSGLSWLQRFTTSCFR